MAKKKQSRVVSSLKKVAEHYGVALSTVKRRWRHQGMPGKPTHWDLDAIDRWRAARQSQMDRTGTLRADGTSAAERGGRQLSFFQEEIERAKTQAALADARKKAADARIRELQAAKAENLDMVDLHLVEEFVSTWLAEARNIFQSIPVKLKRFGPDVSKAMSQEIDFALHAIVKKSERMVKLRRDQ